MPCQNWLTKFTAVIQRQSWCSIVRRNPIEIVQYVQYRNAPQRNTNANSRLSWLLTTSFNADDCSSYFHSTYYCQRFAVEHCLFAFLHVPIVLSHRLMPLIQVDRSRSDAWLIDCKWLLKPVYSDATQLNSTSSWVEFSCVVINGPLLNINSKPPVNELSGASTKLQLSWNKLVTTCLEWVMLVYTRITHSRQCCNYNLIYDNDAGLLLKTH